ncbi:MAG TPA: sigma-70 family RNA polymerase sigma factor, partial [Thermoanaerobaculia bacterium]|nr:sigma-70 family RNA polymerase sigma factor [Thermoanaerobaculia bacterium]
NRERENVAGLLDTAKQKVCEILAITESELAVLLLYTNPNPKAWFRFWYELGDLPEGMSPQVENERLPFLQDLKQHGRVQKAIDELTLEQKTIVKLRYGVLQDDELTLRDIGEILGLSRERVRQIESRAEAKCRRSVRRDR